MPVSHHVKLMCSVLVIAKGCLGAQSVLSKGFNGSKQTTIKIALTLKLSKESPTGWETRQDVSSLLECFHFNAEIRIRITEWLHLSLFLDSHSPSFVFVSGRYSARQGVLYVNKFLSYSESEWYAHVPLQIGALTSQPSPFTKRRSEGQDPE